MRVQEHYQVKVAGKNETIDKLKNQLDRMRNDYQTLRREALVKVCDFEIHFTTTKQKQSGVDDNTVKELDSIAYVKQEYFYSLALGLKLELSSRGSPCNLDIGELFQEALYHVPVQQWNSWLAQRFRDNSAQVRRFI